MSSNIYETVLLLVRKSMYPSYTESVSVSDWEALFQELRDQAVLTIPTNALAEIAPPQEYTKIIRNVSFSIRTMHRHLMAQDDVVRLFQEEAIGFVILKGLAVARYYPKPEYRSLGDIDIAVLHDDYERARQILLQNDYEEVESPYIKHSVYEKNGLCFELHKYFTSTNDAAKATVIEELIQDGIRHPVNFELEGYSFPVLPPFADGIMLLEHMSQHLESGIGLRHLLDWMVYVSHELDDDTWRGGFCETAETVGLRILAEVATKLCKENLGLTGITWCDDADDMMCAKLLAHIELRGNFGRKELSPSEKNQKLFINNKGLFYWFRYLQRTGMRIQSVQRHRLLYPFAWFFRGIELVSKYMKSKRTFRDLRLDLELAKEKESFLDGLGIRRVSKGHTYLSGKTFIIKK